LGASYKETMKDDEEYEFLPENAYVVIDKIKGCSRILSTIDTQTLVDRYMKVIPKNEAGAYPISDKTLETVGKSFVDETLSGMIDKGWIDMSWDENSEEFLYGLTEKGKSISKEML